MTSSPKEKNNKLVHGFINILSFIKKLLQVFTIFLRYLWLIFPACLFLFAAYSCFWTLSQGKDLLISSLENNWRVSVLWIALVFWVFATWYSSRILVYKNSGLFKCGEDYFKKDQSNRNIDVPSKGFNINWVLYKCSETLGFHLPRLMGYLCFSIIILAYWQLPIMTKPISHGTASLLLVGYILLYIIFNSVFSTWGNWIIKKGSQKLLYLFYWLTFAVFIVFFFFQYYVSSYFRPQLHTHAFIVIALTTILQHLFLFVVINRRQLMTDEIKPSEQRETFIENDMSRFQKTIRIIFRFVDVPWSERRFFFIFNFISLIAICIYLGGVMNIHFAMNISSMNFTILAFGILVGYFGLVSIFSLHFKINFHIIILILVIIFASNRESHYIRLTKKDNNNILKERPDLKTYFLNWAQHNKNAIGNSKDSFPVFFVLADGGASRSGYWDASVLGKFHDETNGKFDEHLFCLSGASGGSVGNGTYFALSYNKGLQGKNFEQDGQEFLKHDFLSYTLARMLGPDFFRPILPFDLKNVSDRAGALEESMEEGTEDTSFKVQFSALVPDTLNHLPILCINTTRMQDGRPGVISNIKIQENTFGKRVDVIGLLKKDTDMRLSTAVIMGARFPYLSPAGRIDEIIRKKTDSTKDSVLANYFVDGGYFDNSGAGVVHEMIQGIQQIIKEQNNSPDSLQWGYLKNLQFYVIHITNSPVTEDILNKVNPLKNDLLAPITTLAGSYGTQTDVNDSRLQKYLQLFYGDSLHYKLADLYYNINHDTLSFPMNWSISRHYQDLMKRQLNGSEQIKQLVNWIRKVAN
jgi:hypothetical protein